MPSKKYRKGFEAGVEALREALLVVGVAAAKAATERADRFDALLFPQSSQLERKEFLIHSRWMCRISEMNVALPDEDDTEAAASASPPTGVTRTVPPTRSVSYANERRLTYEEVQALYTPKEEKPSSCDRKVIFQEGAEAMRKTILDLLQQDVAGCPTVLLPAYEDAVATVASAVLEGSSLHDRQPNPL
jgi:hypothetical protein